MRGVSLPEDHHPVWPRRLSFSTELASFERAAVALGRLSNCDLAPRAAPLLMRAAIVAVMNAQTRAVDGAGAGLLCLREVLLAEAFPQPARISPVRLHLALNAIKAAEIGLAAVHATGRAAFTPELLRAMHTRLCAGLAVRGTSETWRAAALAQICARLNEPTAALQEDCGYAPPLVARMGYASTALAALAPSMFGSDVLARLVAGLVAAAEGMPAVIVGCVPSRAQAGVAQGDHAPLRSYFEAVADAARHGAKICADMRELHAGWVRRMATLRSDCNARRLIDHAFDTPIMSVPRAETLLDVSFQTANAAVATLVAHDILSSHGGQRRNRLFVMHEVLDLFGAVTGDGPALPAPSPGLPPVTHAVRRPVASAGLVGAPA